MVDHVPPQHRGTSIFRTYAWLIAIVGILIFIGSGLIYLIYQTWKTHAEVGVGIGVVLLLGAVLLRPDVVRTVIAGRPVKYASNALVMSLAFIGIVGLVNFLVAKNTWEYDLTESAQFTFSQQTIQVLEKLDRPVEIIGFFQSGDPRQDLAKGYLERSSQYTPYLTYEFHDPNIEPTLAQSYELSNYGLVFVSGNNTLEAHTVDEETITSGLIRVTSDQQKQVYFITGHGELGLTNPAPEGLSEVKAALEQENYLVQTINLATALDSLSADSTILILAGAKRDLLDPEVAVLNDWMSTGGKFMILSNPLDPIPLPQLLENYGLSLGDDLVADEDNYKVGLAPTSPLIVQYPFHEITQGLNGFFTFFPLARSLTIEPKDISIARLTTPILTTGPNSWAETDLKADKLEYNEGVDAPGPIHIGAIAEDEENGSRLVIFGSADFITNKILNEVSNRDLFMNAVNWLAEEEDLISIRPKPEPNRRLFLTPMQHTLTILTTLILIPLSLLVVGVGVWWKRR